MITDRTEMALVQPKSPAMHDGLAVGALISAFLCWPLGIVLGHCSNHNAKVAWREKSGVAVAGLVISYVGLAIFAAIVIAVIIGSIAAGSAPAPTG
jgi:peptidyl-prolyl cis-trans isomerase B (cyclophilin B)